MAFNSNYVSIPVKAIADLDCLRWNHKEPCQKHRSHFSKDRDRILYSKSFLRLRGKTQVFMLQKNDYIRTRMTHSLEVNQIAKTIASALRQNIDLVEAVALGHDVGHTPFGHVGERTIAKMLVEDKSVPDIEKGFKHNLQALRLLCDLEKGADYPQSKGLNLTKYTLWGIANHSSLKKEEHPLYKKYIDEISTYWSFEGFIVALADEIAQRHHDIEDSLCYGILSRENLLCEISKFKSLFGISEKQCFKRLSDEYKVLSEAVFNSLFSRLVVNLYVSDAIRQSKLNLRDLSSKYAIKKQSDFQSVKSQIQEDDYEDSVALSQELKQYDNHFQTFLKDNVLNSYEAQAMDGKAEYIIRRLYKAFCDNPKQLPDTALCSYAEFLGLESTRNEALKNVDKEENKNVLHRCIADYIGGMTDQFAYDEFDRLYGTRI